MGIAYQGRLSLHPLARSFGHAVRDDLKLEEHTRAHYARVGLLHVSYVGGSDCLFIEYPVHTRVVHGLYVGGERRRRL